MSSSRCGAPAAVAGARRLSRGVIAVTPGSCLHHQRGRGHSFTPGRDAEDGANSNMSLGGTMLIFAGGGGASGFGGTVDPCAAISKLGQAANFPTPVWPSAQAFDPTPFDGAGRRTLNHGQAGYVLLTW